MSFSPARGGHPSALNMGGTIKTSTFAASPTPSIGTIFLCLVSTILARGSATVTSHATTDQILRTSIVIMVEIQKPLLLFLHVVALCLCLGLDLGLGLVLPELNSTATCPISEDVVRIETWRGGEEGDDADAKCSGGAE